MPNNIDWKFIANEEGAKILVGYVPLPKTSNSGVTIASGFDLGQHSEGELNALKLSKELTAKLKPYLSPLKKQAAVDFLKKHPLKITREQAEEIDIALKKKLVPQLKTRYNNSTFNTKKIQFEDLPGQAQTAIASLSFQYGDLSTARNTYWQAVSAQDWEKAAKILRSYGDYKPRRGREAALLEQLVKYDEKKAQMLNSIGAWYAVFIIGVFFLGAISAPACQAQQVATRIFDADLAKALKNYDKSLAEKKTRLLFESGKTVETCGGYLKEKKNSTVKSDVSNMLYASEYVVCDELTALNNAKTFAKKAALSTDNFGKEIYNRLNIADVPTSLIEGSTGKAVFLKDKLPKSGLKITKYKVESDAPNWFFAVDIVAVTDCDGDGKPDWILQIADEAKDRNYRQYSAWLVRAASDKGILRAEKL